MKAACLSSLLVLATATPVPAEPPTPTCAYPTAVKPVPVATPAGFQGGVRYTFKSGTEATAAAVEIKAASGVLPRVRPPGSPNLDYLPMDAPKVNSFFGITPRFRIGSLGGGLARLNVLMTFKWLATEMLATCPANPNPARDNYSDPETGDVKPCKKRNPCNDPANPECQAARGGVSRLDATTTSGVDNDGDGYCDEASTPCADGTPAPNGDPTQCKTSTRESSTRGYTCADCGMGPGGCPSYCNDPDFQTPAGISGAPLIICEFRRFKYTWSSGAVEYTEWEPTGTCYVLRWY